MALTPPSAFVWGANGQRLTPEQISMLRALEARKQIQGVDTSPVDHWTQGAARVVDALGDVLRERRVNAADEANRAEDAAMAAPLANALTASYGLPSSTVPMSGAGGEVSATAPAATAPVTAKGEVADYIRQSAMARGIDPDIALRVAMSEGGVTDPVRQSEVIKNGVREPSYGPFQLYMNGGLGNKALAAGIDPRDPNQWRQGVDFALDQAKAGGWGPWYGARRIGITGMQGIGTAPVQVASLDPSAGMGSAPSLPIVPPPSPTAQPDNMASVSPDQMMAMLGPQPTPGYRDPMVTTAYQAPPPPMTAARNQPQAAPPLPPPTTVADAPAVAAVPQQVAQAQLPQPPQLPSVPPQILAQAIQAAQSPYASEQTKSIANLLIKRQQDFQQAQQQQQQFLYEQQYKAAQEAADPMRQAQLQKLNQDIAAGADRTPESVRALKERARLSGLQEGTPEYNAFIQTGGARTPQTLAPPPTGYQYNYDGNGNVVSVSPIPGSPQALEAERAAARTATAQESRDTATDVVVTAADRARQAADAPGLPSSGMIGNVLSVFPETNAAEVRRQLGPLRATSSLESLNAMRAASPTGGALGNVTDSEQKLLQDKAGALDPSSPNFARDLDDYERNVLRVIHGKEAGDRIYAATRRQQKAEEKAADVPEGVDPVLWQHMTPEEKALWK